MTRAFPKFEFVFQPEQTELFLRRVDKICKQLAHIAATGTQTEKERASAALAAFSHAVDLVKELGEMRFKMAEEATSANGRR